MAHTKNRPQIRSEEPRDEAAIRAIHTAAFPTAGEAALVDRLREQGAVCVSLVASIEDAVVGHALFTHAQLQYPSSRLDIGALGPIAVLPAQQATGIGGALIRSGLAECAKKNLPAVIVLGHPSYYPRFGFQRADTWNIQCEFPAPPEAFMINWSTAPKHGPALAKYHPAFSEL